MNTLKAEKRDMKVKAKRLRREGYVTGNLFGRKIPVSIPLKMTRKDINQLLSVEKKGGQIMLNVEGQDYDVLIKDIEFDTMLGNINEIDFQALESDVKVHTTAEIVWMNTDKIITGVFQIDLEEIPYKAYPSALVSEVKVDVGAMKVDDVLRVKDLDIAKNSEIELMIPLDTVIASVVPVRNEVPEETTETDDTAAAPAADATK